MCKIMDDYSREVVIEATIRTALMLNATTEQIILVLKQQYNLERDAALERVKAFKDTEDTDNEAKTLKNN